MWGLVIIAFLFICGMSFFWWYTSSANNLDSPLFRLLNAPSANPTYCRPCPNLYCPACPSCAPTTLPPSFPPSTTPTPAPTPATIPTQTQPQTQPPTVITQRPLIPVSISNRN